MDGEPEATTQVTTTNTQNGMPLTFGRGRGIGSRPAIYLTGSLGQVRIWARPLAPEEVADFFGQGPLVGWQDGPSLTAGQALVGDWRCNEGYGTTAYDYALGDDGTLGGPAGPPARPVWTVSTIRIPQLFDLSPGQAVTLAGLRRRGPGRPPQPPPKPGAAAEAPGPHAEPAPPTRRAHRPRRRRTPGTGGS